MTMDASNACFKSTLFREFELLLPTKRIRVAKSNRNDEGIAQGCILRMNISRPKCQTRARYFKMNSNRELPPIQNVLISDAHISLLLIRYV